MIQITFRTDRLEAFMSNLFQKTSSNWARYDKYEWKEDKEGTLYITPSPDAKVSLYNPLKDSEQMVLKAVNLGLMCMDKNNTQECLQNAIMDFVTGYGLLGFMTALPTTPDFITYHAVYLPKNHFIKEESMTTEKYLSYEKRNGIFMENGRCADDGTDYDHEKQTAGSNDEFSEGICRTI